MGNLFQNWLWFWVILDSAVCTVLLPDITDGNFMIECVREHNRARSSVRPAASDMLHMTWDAALAVTARTWAKHCLFEHNTFLHDVRRVHPTFSSVGENIWTGYPPSTFNVTSAINRWVDENRYYTYVQNTCTKICGHYTQVVWASSYKVGCAAQLCPDGVKNTDFAAEEGVIFVCNYAAAGNVEAWKPYKSDGAACSGCESSCVENLCRSPERDSQNSYNWAPDWGPGLTTSVSNDLTVLVVRPVALILTFISAFTVHYFYPDVFCYE